MNILNIKERKAVTNYDKENMKRINKNKIYVILRIYLKKKLILVFNLNF